MLVIVDLIYNSAPEFFENTGGEACCIEACCKITCLYVRKSSLTVFLLFLFQEFQGCYRIAGTLAKEQDESWFKGNLMIANLMINP